MLPRLLPEARVCDVPTGRGANIDGVPTISRFFGITITMYFDDHGHPHFHVRHAEGAAKIRVDVVEVIDSNLPTRHLRLAPACAELHQEELLDIGVGPSRVRHFGRLSR